MRQTFEFRLFIDGGSSSSESIVGDVQQLCSRHLGSNFAIEIVDVSLTPATAAQEQVVALPTLEINAPGQASRLVGDFRRLDKYLLALAAVISAGQAIDQARQMYRNAEQMRLQIQETRSYLESHRLDQHGNKARPPRYTRKPESH